MKPVLYQQEKQSKGKKAKQDEVRDARRYVLTVRDCAKLQLWNVEMERWTNNRATANTGNRKSALSHQFIKRRYGVMQKQKQRLSTAWSLSPLVRCGN